MRRVTREVDLGEVRDLLERVPRACIAVAGDDGPRALPIRLVWREGRYLAGIRDEDAGGRPGLDQEAVVLVDEGVHYFDLRAVYIRGRLDPAEPPAGAADPRVSVLFEAEEDLRDLRVLRIRGRARVRTDRKAQRSYDVRVARKYLVTPDGLRHTLAHVRESRLRRQYRAQSAEGAARA